MTTTSMGWRDVGDRLAITTNKYTPNIYLKSCLVEDTIHVNYLNATRHRWQYIACCLSTTTPLPVPRRKGNCRHFIISDSKISSVAAKIVHGMRPRYTKRQIAAEVWSVSFWRKLSWKRRHHGHFSLNLVDNSMPMPNWQYFWGQR